MSESSELFAKNIRLHILGIPHTITTNAFSHCAFTGKVLRFSPMMISRGFEVYHYGTEGSESNATKQIDLLTKDEWNELRLASYKYLHPTMSNEDILSRLNDPTAFIGDLANWNTPLYKEFNKRLMNELPKYYRGHATDLVCLPFSPGSYEDSIGKLNVVCIESGIGYGNPTKKFRVFESYAAKHKRLGVESIEHCSNYWFVVPNYYNVSEWKFVPSIEKPRIGFFGRITRIKGCEIFAQIAERFPHIEFVMCGQGDPSPYLREKCKNLVYNKPIHSGERSDYLGSLTAIVCPSLYVEPFCGVNVEAQLCGTPVIANDFGAFVETVEDGKTGYLCHTMADYCRGVQMALDGKFDREYIRNRAVQKYDMYNVAKQYEYVFKCVIELSTVNNGWYSPFCYKKDS
jgi:glycosyltransferase involved in cell wall biosynthesis